MKVPYMNSLKAHLKKYNSWDSILIRQKVLLKIILKLENYRSRRIVKIRESFLRCINKELIESPNKLIHKRKLLKYRAAYTKQGNTEHINILWCFIDNK